MPSPQVCAEAKEANSPTRQGGQVTALKCLLLAKQQLAALFAPAGEGAEAEGAAEAARRKVVVSFLGVETGKVEALVRAVRDDEPTFASGARGACALLGGAGVGGE